MSMMNVAKRAAACAMVLATTACAGGGLGGLEQVLGGVLGAGQQQGGQIVAEVQGVDTRNQIIRVTTQQGQTGDLRYDQNTVVSYQNQRYDVTALERGDVVALQIQQTQNGQAYVQQVVVQQSVQDRGGVSSGGSTGGTYGGNTGTTSGNNIRQFAGRVGQIDYNQGWFTLQTSNAGTVTVSLPYNPGQAASDQFRRLRQGDSVRLEANVLSNNRVELYRFY
ncbi:MAG TPA: hypothetical protein VF665_07580 [Longimicrobium sp.]|jgi:exosome complex RNA-binding protein Csl4|uniref:hypothetical protein n=1 Tax=Longimicrobium sp. TaxID=2029185 RepID=UPI002EDB81E3